MVLRLVTSLFPLLCCACIAVGIPLNSPKDNNADKLSYQEEPPGIECLVDVKGDGSYSMAISNSDSIPQALQGERNWIMTIYKNLRYPASARENGTQGIVMLSLLINKTGQLTEIEIISDIGDNCGSASRDAVWYASKQGFDVFLYQGMPRNYKLILPVGFRLG